MNTIGTLCRIRNLLISIVRSYPERMLVRRACKEDEEDIGRKEE